MKNLLLLTLLFCGCASKKKTIIGIYVSKTNLVNRLFINDRVMGIKLEIKENNKYRHQTCAQISDGTWRQSNDSLFLKCEHTKFKIDSFNHKPEYIKGTICDDEIEVYKISNQSLKRKIIVNNQTIYFVLEKE